jgi:GxxExxY protein
MASPVRSHSLRVNEVTGAIITSAMKVHSLLVSGLPESAYQTCLAHELRSRGFEVAIEVPVPQSMRAMSSEWDIELNWWSKN